MVIHSVEADLVATVLLDFNIGGTWNIGATFSSTAIVTSVLSGAPFDNNTQAWAVASLTATANVYQGAGSSGTSGLTIRARGRLYKISNAVYIYNTPTGTVNNIEDLPASPADGTVYNVLGTTANREACTAIYSSVYGWTYQPFVSGTSSELSIINPAIGKHVTMPDYANFNGIPFVPTYWSQNTISPTVPFAYTIVEVPETPPGGGALPRPPEDGGTVVQWRWKSSDLSDPGTGKYALSVWPAHNGVGPTWFSKDFYRPQVKGTVKFNGKKNKTRAQRAVVFNHKQVDHMWMDAVSVPQPFTYVMVGIIHSYPTAKYGHYVLDSGWETPILDANKTGRDFFGVGGERSISPRNVMLYMKKSARMGTNTENDIKDGPNIRIKHSEKARPRMFYGVFNGANSMFGARDIKSKYRGTGSINGGTHRYFVMGRRTNRVSDNRASVMSVFEIILIHKALSTAEIDGLYEEMAGTYQFKEYV